MRGNNLLALCSALVVASCSSQPLPEPVIAPTTPPPTQVATMAPVPVAPPPPAPAPLTFTGELKADAVVALTDDGAPVTPDSLNTALAAEKTAVLACLAGGEPKPGNAWFVARVSMSGALEELRSPTSDTTPEQAKCLEGVLSKTMLVVPAAPLAVSFTLSFKPDVSESALAQTNSRAPSDGSQAKAQATKAREDALSDAAKQAQDSDGISARGNMWGDEIGDSFGAGGLGLSGIGESAGGRGEGIGLGSIGKLGHGAGTGTGQGFGNGHGRLAGSHKSSSPSIRMGAVTVSGRLPPEVIQRIVRQNFGRFRLCYENGLRTDPSLLGRIVTEFTIGRDGSVTAVSRGKGTDLDSSQVVNCVVRAFTNLSFPQPEGGIVKVIYPVSFSPGDDANTKSSKPAARKAFTVAKKKVKDIDAETVASLLKADQRAIASVGIANGTTASPFAVFVRVDGQTLVVRRLKTNAKGFAPVERGSERITPDNWALRVEGPSALGAHDLLTALIDS